MILPGSYANGFAPRDGQPLYPELWRGCVGAWAPCLGPTGLMLRDWSGFANHGTLTNMDSATDWIVSGGRYALDVDGTNDHVPVSNKDRCYPLGNFTYSLWLNARSGIYVLSDYNSSALQSGIAISISGMRVTAFWENGGFPQCVSTTTLVSGRWYHVGFTWDGTIRSLYINGVLEATNTTAQSRPSSAPGKLTIGRAGDADGLYASAQVADLMVWSRCLPQGQISLLSRRSGIAYELAQRRRSLVSVQFNRRRRLLVGAGS